MRPSSSIPKPARLAWVALMASTAVSGLHGAEPADSEALAAEVRELRKELESLRQEVRILRRQREVDEEQAAERAGQQPRISVGTPNVEFRSANSKYSLKIRGFVQADSRWYLNSVNTTNGAANPRGDTFLIRRARLVTEGRFFDDFTYFFQPEFGGANVALLDASLNYALRPELQLKVGRFKVPSGLEYLETPTFITAMDWSVVTGLLPLRDNGFTVHGDIREALFSYEAGLVNGAADGVNASSVDFDGGKDVVLRLFSHPFAGGPSWLSGLGIGVGGLWGRHEGASSRMAPLQSGGYSPVFSLRSDPAVTAAVEEDGDQWRVVPQLYYYNGPVGVMAEHVINRAEYRGGVGRKADQHMPMENSAWHVDFSYVLTGEDATYRGVVPRHNFSLSGEGWGAVQVFTRYAELHIDPNAFPVLANPDFSVRGFDNYVAGLNWYVNPNVRINLHYSLTRFEGGDLNHHDRPTEHAILTRFQFSF